MVRMGNDVRALRQDHRPVQAELAQRLSVSRQTVNSIEAPLHPVPALAIAIVGFTAVSMSVPCRRHRTSGPAYQPVAHVASPEPGSSVVFVGLGAWARRPSLIEGHSG